MRRCVSVLLPLATVNEGNQRDHWAVKAKRVKAQRSAAHLAFKRAGSGWDGCRLLVTLTRVSPRVLDDDGVVSALKAVRDGVADALRVNDRDPRVSWLYAQRHGAAAVEVRVEPA